MYTYIEVEASDNCPMSASQVYANLSDPVRLSMVRVFQGDEGGSLFSVTGWSSEGSGSTCAAYGVKITDSGSGTAWLVYEGDRGIRLRPADSSVEWSIDEPDQWGETHLVLADAEDLISSSD